MFSFSQGLFTLQTYGKFAAPTLAGTKRGLFVIFNLQKTKHGIHLLMLLVMLLSAVC